MCDYHIYFHTSNIKRAIFATGQLVVDSSIVRFTYLVHSFFIFKRQYLKTGIMKRIMKIIREGMKLSAGDKIRLILQENRLCIKKIEKEV